LVIIGAPLNVGKNTIEDYVIQWNRHTVQATLHVTTRIVVPVVEKSQF